MRGSMLWLSVSVLAVGWQFGAAAQNAPDTCLQQGLRPGSAAFHACVTALREPTGMFDPSTPASPELPPRDGAMSATDPDDPLTGLDPLAGDRRHEGGQSAGWDWSQTRK